MSYQSPMGYQSPNPPAALPTSMLAIVSLVTGLLGFTFVPFVGSIVAIITGMLARNETRATPPTASGDGLATAGIIMGWIGVGLGVCGICAAIIFLALPFLAILFGAATSGGMALQQFFI